MLYYRAVITLGDDHGYTLHYYTIYDGLCLGRGLGDRWYHPGSDGPGFPTAPRVIHCGGTTGQAETIQDEVGLGPGRCPRVLNNNTLNEFWVFDLRLPLAYTH